MSALLTTALALLAFSPHPTQEGRGDWIPIDDPEHTRLPAALRPLVGDDGQAFETGTGDAVLIARHVVAAESIEAFMADEQIVGAGCELIPVGEDVVDAEHGEGLILECEVTFGEVSGRVVALYSPRTDGSWTSLWLARPGQPDFAALGDEVRTLSTGFADSLEPVPGATNRSIVLGHDLAFHLGGDASFPLDLTPDAELSDADYEFHKLTIDGHPAFRGDCVRQWSDAARGLAVSFQVVQGDRSVGPKEPLVHHVAEEHQVHERVSKEEGDVPIELLHFPEARTMVVSAAELERHYRNNKKAADAGVILQVYVPRSPFARALRLRWTEGEGEELEHVLATYVELRSYPRVRSETVTRSALVVLQARSADPEALSALERGLDFESHPIERPAPFEGRIND